jgi:sporulation protein YlmC with PRC-barrel domain
VTPVKVIHKISGKLVYDNETANNVGQFHSVHVDPAKGRIDLVNFQMKISLVVDK